MSIAGVAWPTGWRTVPLWSMFRRVKDVGHPDEEMLSVYREHGVVRKESRDDNFNKTAENRNIYQLVDDGWLIVNRMKAWQGSLGISPYRGIVSGHYICFEPTHHEDSRFLNYLLRSSVYTVTLQQMSRGVRPNQIEIDNDELRALPLHLPGLAEQRAIADYLDAETARIDALIAKKQQLIHVLEERIDAAIMEFVGRSEIVVAGGEPPVEIRRVLEKLDRPPMVKEMITAFRDGQVTTRSARGKEGFTNSWTDKARVQGVHVGDVIVHGLDGFSGAIGDSEADGVCSPVYHVCRPQYGGDPAFYGRLLRRLALTGYLGNFAVSTRERAVDFRNWDLFGRVPIPRVPAQVQLEVGERIRGLRPLVAAVEQSEALAAERKTALISRVVAGERPVPALSA